MHPSIVGKKRSGIDFFHVLPSESSTILKTAPTLQAFTLQRGASPAAERHASPKDYIFYNTVQNEWENIHLYIKYIHPILNIVVSVRVWRLWLNYMNIQIINNS